MSADDPIADLVEHLVRDGRPPLAWVVRWSQGGREPVAAAWEQSEALAMLGLLERSGAHKGLVRAACAIARLVVAPGDDLAVRALDAADAWCRGDASPEDVSACRSALASERRPSGANVPREASFAAAGLVAYVQGTYASRVRRESALVHVCACVGSLRPRDVVTDTVKAAVPTPPTLQELLARLPAHEEQAR